MWGLLVNTRRYLHFTALVGFLGPQRSNFQNDFMYITTIWIQHDTVKKNKHHKWSSPRIHCFIQSRQSTEQPTKAAVEVCELQSVCSHLLNNHMREQWDWLLRFPCLGSWHSTSCLSPLLWRIIQVFFSLSYECNIHVTLGFLSSLWARRFIVS